MDVKQKKNKKIFYRIDSTEQSGHDRQIVHGIFRRLGEFERKSIVHLGVCGRLQQIGQRQSDVLIVAPILDQIDLVGQTGVGEPEFLLVETSVFDAARQVVHSLALDNVRQNQFDVFGPLVTAYPHEIADRQPAHLEVHLFCVERLEDGVERSLRFAGTI